VRKGGLAVQVDFQALVPELLDGEHTGAAIDTAATAIGAERTRTLAQARDLAGSSDESLTLNDAVMAAMVKRVDEMVGDALRRGDEVKWGRVQHLQKEVLIELAIETEADTAFERVREERQTKTIVEQIVGRTIKSSEVVNASNGGRAFRIEAQ